MPRFFKMIRGLVSIDATGLDSVVASFRQLVELGVLRWVDPELGDVRVNTSTDFYRWQESVFREYVSQVSSLHVVSEDATSDEISFCATKLPR